MVKTFAANSVRNTCGNGNGRGNIGGNATSAGLGAGAKRWSKQVEAERELGTSSRQSAFQLHSQSYHDFDYDDGGTGDASPSSSLSSRRNKGSKGKGKKSRKNKDGVRLPPRIAVASNAHEPLPDAVGVTCELGDRWIDRSMDRWIERTECSTSDSHTTTADDDDGLDCDERPASPLPSEMQAMRQYMRDSSLEVVVLVEGIEPLTSCTVQARHSCGLVCVAGPWELNSHTSRPSPLRPYRRHHL